MLLCVQDSAILEEFENNTDSDAAAHSDTTSNLLSSGILTTFLEKSPCMQLFIIHCSVAYI